MARAVTISDDWKNEANRSWGLTVLKTAYRDTYPKVSAETILKNAQTLEEKMFENSNSKKGYDVCVSKAADSIKSRLETNKNEEQSCPEESPVPVFSEDNHTINAGRTPCSRAGKTRLGFDDITSGVKPMHAALRRLKMADARKSLTPIARASRNQISLPIKSESRVEMPLVAEEHYFSGTRLDPSDVMRVVPFILEAGFHVSKNMESAEQARNLTEGETSTITFVAMNKMSRAEQFAGTEGTGPTPSAFEERPLSAYEQEQVKFRAKNLQRAYMYDITTIYAKLGERFATPECDEDMISNIGFALKQLEELEGRSCEVSSQTMVVLDNVENVFRAAMMQYGHLVKGGRLASNGFMPPNGYDQAGASWATGSVIYPYPQQEVASVSTRDEFTSHYMLKARYGETVKNLIPLIKAELAKQHIDEGDETCEKMAYASAFLKLENVTDVEVLRSAERVMQDLCNRFGYLLVEGSRTTPQDDDADVEAWNRPSLERGFDFKHMTHMTGKRVSYELTQTPSTGVSTPRIEECDGFGRFCESDGEGYGDGVEEGGRQDWYDDYGALAEKVGDEDEVSFSEGSNEAGFSSEAETVVEDEESEESEESSEEGEEGGDGRMVRVRQEAEVKVVKEEAEVTVTEDAKRDVGEGEESCQEVSSEAFTPRRSRRAAVVASRANGGKTAGSGRARPSRAGRAARAGAKGGGGATPGRVLRPRKTPARK